ncbi:hypothetical protein [Clostridium polynesiense]|uniref:hypothetical protein n=1 Tax=Clostridium polynesiense TaxID=1325933 RepID=UPI00058BB944|nr:hypothetical protein [Clostridium polynesiense]
MGNFKVQNRLRLILILTVLIFIFIFQGCGHKQNKVNKLALTEVKLQKLTPIMGQDNTYKYEIINTVTDKNLVNKIAHSIENAEKEEKDLGYVKNNEMHHEIRLVYKNIDKKSFSLWIEKNVERAVISNLGYFYLDKDTTELLKSLLFEDSKN